MLVNANPCRAGGSLQWFLEFGGSCEFLQVWWGGKGRVGEAHKREEVKTPP